MKTDLPTLNKLREINDTYPRVSAVEAYKREGRKALGWLCSYVPEELLYAAGTLPVRLTGYHSEQNLSSATAKLNEGICTFARSCLQTVIDGDTDYYDGFVGANCCDHTRRLTEFLDYHKTASPFNAIINPPLKMTDDSALFFTQELMQLKEKLETFTGSPITDEALWDAIELHNETRALVRRLYALRKQDPAPISGAEVLEVMNASYIMPKPEFNSLLSELLTELESRSPAPTVRGGPRLMVLGSPMTNPAVFREIEEMGAQIVMEEMCTAGRHYWDDVRMDNKAGDPVHALADRYLTNFPCARMIPTTSRFEHLLKCAEEWNVHGVISANIRFCTLYIYDIPILRDVMEQAEMPLLELNMEYNEGGKGQFRTRIQAFLEMIATQGGKAHA